MLETARSKARTAFLDEGEIDEFMIHVIPKFIGEGIPLIAPGRRTVPLGSTSAEKDLIRRVRETPPGASDISVCLIRMDTSCRLHARSNSLPATA
jgi:riboflavin biosynthesis pyrimidine reductase